MYDALVFIGRFQPIHKGHQTVIDKAIDKAKEVIIVVGSSFASRTTRNPFTFEERKAMIKAVYPQPEVKVVPVMDYPYDDNKWVNAIQQAVIKGMKWTAEPYNDLNIGLIGHNKDETSYYLKMFPRWGSVDVPQDIVLNATDIREALFSVNIPPAVIYENMSKHSYVELLKVLVKEKDEMGILVEEANMITKYKQSWESAPYPPSFITSDAVVTQSGHLLLVKRKHSPGKGLWAIPGGFVDQNETFLQSAVRELKEETKIKVPERTLLKLAKRHKIFDDPKRSERGRTVTNAFLFDLGFDSSLPKVTAADDAEAVKWIPFNEVKSDEMFEDHYHIVDYFLNIG